MPDEQPASTPQQPEPLSAAHDWYGTVDNNSPTSEQQTPDRPNSDQPGSAEQAPATNKEPNLLLDSVSAKNELSRVYADFKAEGIQLDKGGQSAISEVTKLLDRALDSARSGGDLNHQDLRDAIVKQGVDVLKAGQDAAAKNQRDVWTTLNNKWKADTRKDPDIGGPKLERSLGMAKALIEEYGGSATQQRELMAHLSNNGMGNYAGFIRLLANVADKMNVFEDFSVPGQPSARGSQKSAGNRGWYNTVDQS